MTSRLQPRATSETCRNDSVYVCVCQDAPSPYNERESISVPLYYSSDRDRLITRMDVPCSGSRNQWLQCGAALCLKSQ